MNNKTLNIKNDFSIIHTNICSLLKHSEDIDQLLVSLDHRFNVIALTETWHSSKNDKAIKDIVLDGYQPYHGTQGSTLKGGCGFSVTESLKFKPRTEFDTQVENINSEFEASWIEIVNEKQKNILLGCIYRHPRKTDNQFIVYMQNIFEKIKKENKLLVIIGDFNLNLLKHDTDDRIKDFLNLMLSNHCQPMITQPTRFSNESRPSLVDNIFINSIEKDTYSGNTIPKISDHLPNFTFIKSRNQNPIKTTNIMVRDFKNFEKDNFMLDLQTMKSFDDSKDVNHNYDTFQDHFIKCLDKYAPLKKLSKRKEKMKKKPWINKEILKSIRMRDKFYKKFIKTKNPEWEVKYKSHRNKINHLIRISKRKYYSNYFQNFKNDSKKIWSGIKEIINKNNKSSSSNICLEIEDNFVTCQKQVADSFNTFYSNVASNLVNKMKKSSKHFNDYLSNASINSLFLTPIIPAEVEDQISVLNESKAPGSYGIPIKIVKISKTLISAQLSKIFNQSFEHGIFPDKLKFACVTPIHKGNSKLNMTNYRPISILPTFNKILEKLMYKRLINFLDKNKSLFQHQFGFQKNKSTSLAILDIYTNLTKSMENNYFSCCVFLDFAKAFDTVNHDILHSKLEHYGIRGVTNKWFKSYLHNRPQTVKIGNTKSEELYIRSGVPQGSVLGPLLFLIYINDIPNSSKLLKFHLFADDTSIFLSDKSIDKIEKTLNDELKNVFQWLLSNKLSLNVKKSNCVIFRPARKKPPRKIKLEINGDQIEELDSTKYLGVILDQKLNWKKHISHVSTKLSKYTGLLYKLRHFVPKSTLSSLYNAFIMPHINYGLINWSSATKTNLTPIKRCLKKAVRAINFAKTRDHSLPLFKKQNLLCFDDIIELEIGKFMFSIENRLLDQTFLEMFKKTNERHTRCTRQATRNDFILPKTKLNVVKRTITYTGAITWNKIPSEIKNLKTKTMFSKTFSEHLRKNY